jgi:biopolymer transport protein ExbD
MGMEVGEQGGSLATPNVVPLIDILLVLIIIFMVITPLIPKGLDTLVPQPNPNAKQDQELENKTVVVQVSKDGKVKINQEDSNWDQLGPRIEQVFKERAEKIAFVKGDNEAEFKDVARAIDIMRGAGIDKIGLITAKLEAGQ